MPITLGCPSCGKRFRARDESAGKKVKCPYCQAAVQVPTPDESASAAAPTAPLDDPPAAARPAPPAAARPAASAASAPRPAAPPGPVVATPADWGALPAAPAAPPPPAAPAPFPVLDPEPVPPPPLRSRRDGGKDRPRPARAEEEKPTGGGKMTEKGLAAGWKRLRGGLFWIQFGLLWCWLIGLVGVGKLIYVRTQGPLPRGDGTDWVSIEGFINAPGPNAIPVKKEQLIDLACYGVPVCIASLMFALGRLIASGAPRMSGSRGLFALSSLFGLFGFAALVATFMFAEAFKDYSEYAFSTFVLLTPLAECWFLTAITASGLALKRPQTARAVGFLAFLVALAAFAATLGWQIYVANWRPKPLKGGGLPDDWPLYEQIALAVGWTLIIIAYWRAVRNVRVAAREYIDTVAEKL